MAAKKRVYKKIPKGKGKPPTKVVKKRRDLKKKERQRYIDGDMTAAERKDYVKKISGGMGDKVQKARPARKAKPKKKEDRSKRKKLTEREQLAILRKEERAKARKRKRK